MRPFKSIYINCYNSLRFVADISKTIQKGHNFLQIKDHNSGRRHETQTNDPIFFICFSSTNCLWNSFFHLKIVKIYFHEVPLSAHSGLQNTWILEVRTNSKIFRVLSWSNITRMVKILTKSNECSEINLAAKEKYVIELSKKLHNPETAS